MKKIYMMPLTEVTKIEAQRIMAGSALHDGVGDSFVQDDFSGSTDDTGDNLSRRNVWDDDED